jgi:fluoroquinolone transport system permease protein
VSVTRVARALGPVDRRTILRDPMLRMLVVLPPLFGALIRWVLPLVFDRIGELSGGDGSAYLVPVAGLGLLILVPMLAGTVVGFLLLDQRDEGTLLALRVTPHAPADFLAYRLLIPVALSLSLTFLLFPVAGIRAYPFHTLLPAALAAAPFAPLFALFLAVLARNKVQGFALMKASGLVYAAPMALLVLPHAWGWALAPIPTFWSARVLWGTGAPWLVATAGILYQSALITLLARRLDHSTTG